MPRPTSAAIEKAVEDYPYMLDESRIRIKSVPVDSLIPTEDMGEKPISRRLVEAVQRRPESIPPLIVHRKDIDDGHHRWEVIRHFYDNAWVIDLSG